MVDTQTAPELAISIILCERNELYRKRYMEAFCHVCVAHTVLPWNGTTYFQEVEKTDDFIWFSILVVSIK